MRPLVSIVMPCFNAASHLDRSVGSVLAQDSSDWQLLIVDDGSTDDSWHQLELLAMRDPRITVMRQSNAGAAAARNRGLDAATGQLIAFLDADDTWEPDFVSSMSAALLAHPEAGIAYCGWQNIGLGGGRDRPFVPPDYETDNKTDALLGGCRWPIHAALTRSELIRNAGNFDRTISSCEDYGLWLRIGTEHALTLVPRVLAYYHHHGGEQTTRNRARIALDHWRVQQKYLLANPKAALELGPRRVRELTLGELLHRGYTCYWQRDISAARSIFRAVMKEGHGGMRDWLYMLPAWLPESWHRRLLSSRDGAAPLSDGQR